MKIIDCFTFYNELELLTYRLNTLNSVVDYFIIVEARQTYMGKDKDLFFEKNKGNYADFKDKIIHMVVDLPIKSSELNKERSEQWINEKYQRNCIRYGIEYLKLNKEDLILICDIDEIPDPLTLRKIMVCDLEFNIYSLEMMFYYYNLNTLSNSKWTSPKILSYGALYYSPSTLDDIRRMECPIIKHGGWHLSYFGDTNFIKNKIENFSHQEFNNENNTELDKITQRISMGQDIFGRWYINFNKVAIKDNTYLPPEYERYLSKFIITE